MMSEMSGKSVVRSRAPNFTKDEQLLLVSSMEPYTRIIECKKTDATKQIDKQNAWSKVAEIYNANTKGVERTVDNLISCYRNMKSKLKKEHSEAKMLLEDPSKKEALINALEENGKDWNAISTSMETTFEVCQSTFQTIQKEIKKHDLMHKRKVLGTDYEGSSLNKKKKNVGDSFYNLSQEKLQLVKLQKEMLELEIRHKRLEIEDKIKENKFKENYRQKELELLELKIKNISE